MSILCQMGSRLWKGIFQLPPYPLFDATEQAQALKSVFCLDDIGDVNAPQEITYILQP